MKFLIKISLIACTCLLFSVAAHAQKRDAADTSVAILKGTGKAGVVVVSSAAKGAWALTRASGKYVVLPVAKTVFVKAAPAVGKYAFKKSLKNLVPMALKIGLM